MGLYLWLTPGIFSLGLVTVLSHHFAWAAVSRCPAMLVWIIGLVVNVAINLVFLPSVGERTWQP